MSQPGNRLPEFHGPEQLLDAVTAAADPHNDGAVVRSFLHPEAAAAILDIAIPTEHKDLLFLGVESEIFRMVAKEEPTLTEVDELTRKLWSSVSVGSLALCDPLNGIFLAESGIDPHIDIRPTTVMKTPDPRFTGPIAMSLALRSSAEFRLEKPPKNDFVDEDGSFDAKRLVEYKNKLNNSNPGLRSYTVQGIGDLMIWVQPYTAHAVEVFTKDRVGLIMEQTQAPPTTNL